jgi:hypothetical protein
MQRLETGNELRSVFLLPEGEGKDEGAVQIDTLSSVLSRRGRGSRKIKLPPRRISMTNF